MIVTDTHKAIRKLTGNGFSNARAECLIDTLNAQGAEVATKTDLAHLEVRLTWKMTGLFSLLAIVVKWL